MQPQRIGCFIKRYFSIHHKLNSVYSKEFIPPIYREEKQKSLFESGEVERLKHTPVKAANDNETSSVFHDVVLAKLANYIMMCGRKETARRQLDKCLELIKKKQIQLYHTAKTPEEKNTIITDPLRLLKMAIQNCKPVVKVIPIRRGGSIYQVPAPITDNEAIFRAMRWLVLASREKDDNVVFFEQLAHEIMEAANNRGRVVKKKIDLHRTCEANRAYAHFRWL